MVLTKIKNLIDIIKYKYREYFPIRVLRARVYPKALGNLVKEYDVNEIVIRPGPEHLEKTKDQFKRLTESMDRLGLLYPVILTSYERYWFKDRWPKDVNGQPKKGLLCVVGNQRVLYARKRKYHKIEGYYVVDKLDRDRVNAKTFKQIYPKTWIDIRDGRWQ